ncbi:multi-sensor signal transduction multi-kinase [Candidatus Magnetomorum sp. HK-1]|nr:multi-sensor signal transduction multi-kinase [Candidatus Magnetomorum sp. HK-1]
MNSFPGFQIIESIYESPTTQVLRCRRNADKTRVIIKNISQEFPSSEMLACFRNEYQIADMLDFDGIIQMYALKNTGNGLMIIMEDFDAISLQQMIARKKMNLEFFLDIAIKTSTILGKIHQKSVIHQDVTTSNIVINPETACVKFIDFGFSVDLSAKKPQRSEHIQGTLSYISPEQTGRMDRKVDYRSDFYSYGVCLYEMITGRLPFVTEDPLRLIHCHIAKSPLSPHELNLDIPRPVSNIIMKLMAKNPEDRYQNIDGIKVDLENCLNQVKSSNKINDFEIGQQDIPSHFLLSKKLYARGQDLERMITIFERMFGWEKEKEKGEKANTESHGKSEVVLIKGDAGVGKSAFIEHVKKHVLRSRPQYQIFFISGKNERFSQNRPYSALVSAFSELIRHILKMDEKKLGQWRKKIQSSLGPNGQLLINVIPEIEWIIGEQEEIIELSPKELQNRFHYVFQNFIMTFAEVDSPLVIFLDDLQWIDVASLKIIQLIITNSDNILFLIGAYRPGKMPDDHPLFQTIQNIQSENIPVTEISLRPLSNIHINKFICDTFRCSEKYAQELTNVVFDKTHGNPFFINEFIQSIYEKQLIKLTDNGWKWNISKIQQTETTDNVAKLMGDKIQKLNQNTRKFIQAAACIGSEFSMDFVNKIISDDKIDIDSCLKDAIAEGLIIECPQPSTDYNSCILNAYTFVYDRVRQAAYALMSDDIRQAFHKKIGQYLLEENADDSKQTKIFDIVNHLNMSILTCTTKKEKIQLARLNFDSGLRAKASTAYDAAFIYFIIGISLLSEDDWTTFYTLVCSLYLEAAEAAYLIGNFDEMLRLSEAVLENSSQLMEQVKAYEIRLQAYKMQDKKMEAIEIGHKVMSMLGVSIPKSANKISAMMAISRIYFGISGKRIENLVDLPEMTDPKQLILVRILTFVSSALYITSPEILPIVISKQIRLFIKYGNPPAASAIYSAYGMILCGMLNDIDNGYGFGRLALSLLKNFQTKEYWAKTLFRTGAFIFHWKEHVRNSLPLLEDACANSIETGDIEFLVFSRYVHGVYSFLAGVELSTIHKKVHTFLDEIPELKHLSAQHYKNLVLQLLENMMAPNEKPWIISGSYYQEEKTLQCHIDNKDRTLITMVYFMKAYLNYLFNNHEDALYCIEIGQDHISGIFSTFIVPFYYYLDALIRLALYEKVSRLEQRMHLKKVLNDLKRLKKWSKHAPMNHQHRCNLIQAEIHRVQKEIPEAMGHYDKAIRFAKENQFLNDEALANELATRFYLNNHNKKHAIPYLLDSYSAYHRFGAVAKTNHLLHEYPYIKDFMQLMNHTSSWNQLLSNSTSFQKSTKEIDLLSIMKASSSISEEIVLSRLLEKLMSIAIENAGATRGCLILVQDKQLIVEAEIDEEKKEQVVHIESIPLTTRSDLPEQLINYVKRTLADVVLKDAANEGDYTNDRYIRNQKIQSVICIPILHHAELTGLLYLENNQMTGAFMPRHLQILKLIASQAAISIENAKFYNQLEGLVQKRTRALSQAIDALKERAHELTVLNKMSDMLNECREEKDTYEVLQKTCSALFPKDFGFIALASSEKKFPKIIVQWNTHNQEMTSEHLSECHSFQTSQKKRITDESIFDICCPFNSHIDINGLCIPLIAQTKTIGVFHLQFSNTNDIHEEDELQRLFQSREELAVRMAEQYSLSLANLRLQEKLLMESVIDPLTSLFNRRYLEASLKRESNRCKRRKKNLGVIMLDIDHFKLFNDQYGHKLGDDVLRELGKYLKNAVRKEDIACRYGGEEFLLILPESDIQIVKSRAENICKEIYQKLTISYENKPLKISASLGVAALNEHGPESSKVIAAADKALYEAKRLGRNQVQIAPFSPS